MQPNASEEFHMGIRVRSTLLDALEWVDYAFQPAGEAPPDDVAYGHQRHSATVVDDEANVPPKSCESDGIIGLGARPVAVYTADCLPVLIADTQQRRVAAVHAGLKGTLAGVLERAVVRLCETGSSPDGLYVAIGPAIAPCCYELGEEMLSAVAPTLSGSQPPCWQREQPHNPLAVRPQAKATRNGVWFDLPQLATLRLIEAGVPAANIENVSFCTYCMAETGSSYRRNTHFNSGYQSRFSWIRRRGG